MLRRLCIVFCCFFTGALSAQTILVSDKSGWIEVAKCLEGQGQGKGWSCQDKNGLNYTCIKKLCNKLSCEFTAENLCYQKDTEVFASMPGDSESLPDETPLTSLLFVSDLHAGREPAKMQKISESMETLVGKENSFELILNGGDLSNHGIIGDLLNTSLKGVFQNPKSLLSSLPMYATLGNHDYCKENPSQLWSEQDPYFRQNSLVWTHEIQKNSTRIGLIFVDTNILAYYPNLASWLKQSCAAMKDHFNYFEQYLGKKDLLSHLKAETLKALDKFKDYDYLLVVGHHPVGGAACGPDGGSGWLKQQLDNYSVSAYLSGHVHSMDFGAQNKTLYASIGTSGTTAGRGCLGSNGWRKDKWEMSKSGFGAVRIFEDRLYFSFYDETTKALLTKSVAKRN